MMPGVTKPSQDYSHRIGNVIEYFNRNKKLPISRASMAEMEHLQALKMDFTPGPECYQKCLDWVEEWELLLSGLLALKSKAIKVNYVHIWAGKAGRTHIKSLNLTVEQKGDPNILLKKFVERTKPKSNALGASSNFRRLKQGDVSFTE